MKSSEGSRVGLKDVVLGEMWLKQIWSHLEEGASLLKTHLSQLLTAGCSPGKVQEQFSREGAAVSHS